MLKTILIYTFTKKIILLNQWKLKSTCNFYDFIIYAVSVVQVYNISYLKVYDICMDYDGGNLVY